MIEWRIAPGERVERGAVLLVIESEKSEVEIEAPVHGFLRYVYVEPGRTVACETLLAVLTETPDEPFDGAGYVASRPTPARTVDPLRASTPQTYSLPARVWTP